MEEMIEPLADRVIVKTQEEEKIKGGIVIPDTVEEKPQQGEVIAVGSGKWENGERIPLEIRVGDKVIYRKYGGTEIKVEGYPISCLILTEDDILAKISKRKRRKR